MADDAEVVVGRLHTTEEVNVVRRKKASAREVVGSIALATDVGRDAEQPAELCSCMRVELQRPRRVVAGHPFKRLVGVDRKADRLHEVVEVGLRIPTAMQLFEAELDLGLSI